MLRSRMGHPDYVRCKRCGNHRDDVGTLSWTRLCVFCSEYVQAENIIGLATMTNPARDRWRRGMAASVGAKLLDDRPDAA